MQSHAIRKDDTKRHDSILRYKSTRQFLPAFKSDILVSRTANMTFSDIRTFSQHICPTGNPNDNEEKRGGHCDFQSTWRGPTHTRQLQVISVVLTRLVNLTNMSFVLTHWHYRYVAKVFTDPIFCLHTQITQDVWPQCPDLCHPWPPLFVSRTVITRCGVSSV